MLKKRLNRKKFPFKKKMCVCALPNTHTKSFYLKEVEATVLGNFGYFKLQNGSFNVFLVSAFLSIITYKTEKQARVVLKKLYIKKVKWNINEKQAKKFLSFFYGTTAVLNIGAYEHEKHPEQDIPF